ncbi:MAG: zinc ribbon domain-containing protein [Pirellulales bacterium]|nr:zinc ribbon domain-containing protein [Pirellulales bacterium]
MSIQVTCPNGHVLKVKDKYAGQTGLCPRCQARIYVPEPAAAPLSEDAIVDLLGPPSRVDLDAMPVHQESRHLSDSGDSLMGGSSVHAGGPSRECPKCRKHVAATYRICPHCWTYFSDSSSSSINKKVRMSCPSCAAEVIPGDQFCPGCGVHLRPA